MLLRWLVRLLALRCCRSRVVHLTLVLRLRRRLRLLVAALQMLLPLRALLLVRWCLLLAGALRRLVLRLLRRLVRRAARLLTWVRLLVRLRVRLCCHLVVALLNLVRRLRLRLLLRGKALWRSGMMAACRLHNRGRLER